METTETYQRYHRFLTEVERKFSASLIGKTESEKREMLLLTQRILDSFTELYGDEKVNNNLQMEARIVLAQCADSPN